LTGRRLGDEIVAMLTRLGFKSEREIDADRATLDRAIRRSTRLGAVAARARGYRITWMWTRLGS
jgi:hypothetical protein